MSSPVIEVTHLSKAYGTTLAVQDVSFSVERGEILGVLGRNGAGKTTTVEIVGGLRHADEGTVRVLGLDPGRDREQLRRVMGLQLQHAELQPKITVRESLELYASFYPDPDDPVRLIDRLGLADKAGTQFEKLSGGQKQRLSVALALVGRPQVAILDELTTGLDPHARREAWAVIRAVREAGVTIVLVTHLMEEAERLCDRIVVFAGGRVVATGTPSELAAQADATQVVSFAPVGEIPAGMLDRLPEVRAVETDEAGRTVVTGSGRVVQAVMVALDSAGVGADAVQVSGTTLEDAFLSLTEEVTA